MDGQTAKDHSNHKRQGVVPERLNNPEPAKSVSEY